MQLPWPHRHFRAGEKEPGRTWGYRHVGLVCWDRFPQQMDREKQRIDYQHRAKERSLGDCVKLVIILGATIG